MPLVLFLCALLVAIICIILIFHRDYEDGLVGRVALALISFTSFVRAMELLESRFELQLSPIATVLWIGLTIFFMRHLYRFLRWHGCGDNDWRQADPPATAGKQ